MLDEPKFVDNDDPLAYVYHRLEYPLYDQVVSLDLDCEERSRQLQKLLSHMTEFFNSEFTNYSFVVSYTVADLHYNLSQQTNSCSEDLLRKVLEWCRTICMSLVLSQPFERKLQHLFITIIDVMAEPPIDHVALDYFIDNLKNPETAWITFCAFEQQESFTNVLHDLWIKSGEQLSDFPEESLQLYIEENLIE